MITTLFHAATSSHPRGQHDLQSPAPQRVRGGRGEAGGRGMITPQPPTRPARPLTRPATGERGDGGGGGEGEGHDKDGQHDHIQSPTRAARPVTGEVGEGGGEGDKRERVGRGDDNDDNDLVSRGQHDHIQSPAPQRANKRFCWRLFRSIPRIKLLTFGASLSLRIDCIAKYNITATPVFLGNSNQES